MNDGMKPGRFITLEGGEGAGKSVQGRALLKTLTERQIDVLLTREPGGTPGAEAIRALLVTGEGRRWSALSETLLFCAARADHLERKIRPALAAGQWVVCDRFADSTRAYQGAAQGLDDTIIAALERITVGNTRPDLTLILDVPVDTGLARAQARGGHEVRYEAFDHAFHERLRAAFLEIARAEPERCVVLDGTRQPDEISDQIQRIVVARFGL